MKELTYEQVADALGFSVRQTKRILIAHRRTIKPIRYSYKTVRFLAPQVAALKRKLRRDAVQRGRSSLKFSTASRAESMEVKTLARQGMK